MKTPLNFQAANRSGSKPARRFNFKLAIGLAALCLGAGLLMPVLKSRAGIHHAMPPGQFQADMRTMVAGIRYLLESEPALAKNPGNLVGLNTDASQPAPGGPLEMSDRSGMSTAPTAGTATNPPVPI